MTSDHVPCVVSLHYLHMIEQNEVQVRCHGSPNADPEYSGAINPSCCDEIMIAYACLLSPSRSDDRASDKAHGLLSRAMPCLTLVYCLASAPRLPMRSRPSLPNKRRGFRNMPSYYATFLSLSTALTGILLSACSCGVGDMPCSCLARTLVRAGRSGWCMRGDLQ